MNHLARHALDVAAFIWGVAEATLFFFVPDVLLSYIGLKNGVKDAARASVIASIGAAVGGVIMYIWSQEHFEAALAAVMAVPAISDAMADRASEAMERNWFAATVLGPLTSTPFKLYALIAPQAGVPLWAFALASIVARLPRFLVIGCGVALIGRALSPPVSPRVQIWLLAGAWLLFYAVFFAVMPN